MATDLEEGKTIKLRLKNWPSAYMKMLDIYIYIYILSTFFFFFVIQIFPRFLYFAFLNIHRWFNITNIIPLSPDDGSLEPKRYSIDFASQ